MIIGLCTVELYFPDSHSLKAKRQILSSLKTRLRAKFNISIAEVDEQDLWQKSILGIACVANESGQVHHVLDLVLNMIQSNPSLELCRSRIELL
ncbi:MAG: DUF503 domain-containing protein [Nitrospirales bacterium]|nr:DUF503 domain-containing protein [Nitrospira sp.]MDR4501572.1 DUF503 domain-containing protein [Nitrospirales bacterium]